MSRDPRARHNLTLAGNPDAAKTLVFVNGLGTDQSVWNQVAPAFAADYRLVLFDNAGTVEANLDDFRANQLRYLNVSGYATDLLEICTALGLSGDTFLVGHSLGGMAGLLASIQRPRLFERLVLIGVSPRYSNTDGYVGGFTKADIDASYDALRRDYLSWGRHVSAAAMHTPERPHLAEEFAASIARIPQDMMLTVLCSVLQTDRRADLAQVTVPVLLIQARNDCFVPLEVAQYLHAHIPGSQLSLIDASGHLPHVSSPEQVLAAMAGFVPRAS